MSIAVCKSNINAIKNCDLVIMTGISKSSSHVNFNTGWQWTCLIWRVKQIVWVRWRVAINLGASY